ncbi:MAG TPA: glycosyltransferase [Edaphobacter sp.]|nr:glycosyltransferase [Edaphobacter sp.]
MRFIIFGLTVSSSWGNGHATLWRGLLKALSRRGHTVIFYERNVPYYANTRDEWQIPSGVTVRIYDSLDAVKTEVVRELRNHDVALITSYCNDGPAVAELILNSNVSLRAFYDLDTPVTLDAVRSGKPVPYLPVQGLSDFDLVLSYTGGNALEELQTRLGARAVVPLYGWVDPETHAPTLAEDRFRSFLSYLGTYAADRQKALEELFISSARERPDDRFLIGGAQYPANFPWTENIYFVRHMPPASHPAFFCSSRATLNVTRQTMLNYGFCPSGRLFEAAACGVPLLTDTWEGLETFFTFGEEILPVHTHEDVLNALSLPDKELFRIASAARERTLEQHTAEHRAIELESICERTFAGASIYSGSH